MDFSWSAIFAGGFAEWLKQHHGWLGPGCCLLSAGGQLLWPEADHSALTQPVWRSALVLDDQVIGYLAGPAGRPSTLPLFSAYLTERLRAIWLERQLQQAQVRLIEEIKAHTELEEALKFMELKALQSQVNPHFLFNTLSTIAGLSIFESATKTTELVQSLSRLLRYSLRSIGQMVALDEELAYVNDYLAIQQARFGDRIVVETDISPHIGQAKVPVLTLQPIVENAIIHGLEAKLDGRLCLMAREEADRVVIMVIDNGVGIDPLRLAEIQELRADMSGRSHTTGLGFANVHKRLQHFFGTSYGLQLESTLGQGTTVTIALPLIQ